MLLTFTLKLCFVGFIAFLLAHGANAAVKRPSKTLSCTRKPPTAEQRMKCFEESEKPSTNNEQDVAFFKECVQEFYHLEPCPYCILGKFKKPQFVKYLRKTEDPENFEFFEKTAQRIERFFGNNKNWENTKKYYGADVAKLLSITNARYLYVTYLLYKYSDYTLTACRHDPTGKIIFVQNVCFLRPYGTTSATSDYDVGLIGKKSGYVASTFNTEFEKMFEMPSELVLDTNIYGYSLEYAMPSLFFGLPTFYRVLMPKLDFYPKYQMLELVGAYVKMKRFKKSYYDQFKNFASQNLGKPLIDRKTPFDKWITKFEQWNTEVPFTGMEDLRTRHNARYSEILLNVESNNLQDTREVANFVLQMSIALVYAAEAYHTKGAMRHVVGVMQLKNEKINEGLTAMDYWVSMVENWADANKGYNHCPPTATACLLTMVKYLYRAFDAMKQIHKLLFGNYLKAQIRLAFPIYSLPAYPNLGTKSDPHVVTQKWVAEYKGRGKPEIPFDEANAFLGVVGCEKLAQPQDALSQACMDKIHDLLKFYNNLLVETTAKPTTKNIILYQKNGREKSKPIFNE